MRWCNLVWLDNLGKLARLDKPIGSLLLLWPTLIALVLAGGGHPHAGNVFIFVCGVFLVRSAGCVFNDVADRHIDKHIERTRDRPITSGKVSVKSALWLCVFLLFLAFILVLFTNEKTIFLAFIAVILAAIYPFLKRMTFFPQCWLGLVFNGGVIMAFSAERNAIPGIAWVLYASAVASTIAYDTMYGMVDRQDDLKIGVKSTAILFGHYDRLMIALCQVVSWCLLWVVGVYFQLNFWYYLGLFAAVFFIFYQQALIWTREPACCFRAFINNHYLWAVVFFALVLAFL
jgi:4-hydroxybenzoate polyprenyltransferase